MSTIHKNNLKTEMIFHGSENYYHEEVVLKARLGAIERLHKTAVFSFSTRIVWSTFFENSDMKTKLFWMTLAIRLYKTFR